ncbi:MAG: TspO/MBR family protein [Oscillospiraceae bacterium]
MYSGKKISLKSLILNIIIPLAVGAVSSLLTFKNMNIYDIIKLPLLAPPKILFPIVWTILYILMGVSSYRVCNSNGNKTLALKLYILQLFFNFCWSLIFFNARWFLTSFIWLATMWILIAVMIFEFKKLDKLSAKLQIPYLVWVTFAGYLNLSIYILNR